MEELIKEIESNKNISIDYVLERLKNINGNLNRILDFFKYHNKNLTKEQEFKIIQLEEINEKLYRELI